MNILNFKAVEINKLVTKEIFGKGLSTATTYRPPSGGVCEAEDCIFARYDSEGNLVSESTAYYDIE